MVANKKSVEGKEMKVGQCPTCGTTVLVYEGVQVLPLVPAGGTVSYNLWTCQLCGSTHAFDRVETTGE